MPYRHSRPLAFGSSLIAALALLFPARASINLFPPGQEWHPGTDGVFAPTANVEIDLSQAVTGTWDQDNTTNSGKGVYDPAKWAVVFKYSSVNIPAGVTVTFKNHDPNAPVVWLVNGDATVAGVVDVGGKNGNQTGQLADPGPGGFRGGSVPIGSTPGSAGLGPGGYPAQDGGAGSYSVAVGVGLPYGHPAINPLIGGSGGAWGRSTGGGAGGGALLIAASGTIRLDGSIQAMGGDCEMYRGGGGSGGAVRIVAESFIGAQAGSVMADGRQGGSAGRIRVENSKGTFSGAISPAPSYSVPSDPPVIWPPATLPTIWITTIGARAVSADPHSNSSFPNQDVGLQTAAPTPVTMQASNVPVDGTWKVYLRVVPRSGQDSKVDAVLVSGDATSSVWEATITAPQGFSALQGRAYKQ